MEDLVLSEKSDDEMLEDTTVRKKPIVTGTKVELQTHDSFFTDNWKTQSKLRKQMGKSPHNKQGKYGGTGNGSIMDDVDLVLGDSDSNSDDEDLNRSGRRRTSRGASTKYDDEDVVKVGRHALPRFESLLGNDDADNNNARLDDMLQKVVVVKTNERKTSDEEDERVKRRKKKKEKKKSKSKNKSMSISTSSASSKTQDTARELEGEKNEEEAKRRVVDEGKSAEEPSRRSKEKKKKKKKKKKKAPRPPSPQEENVTGPSANTVRMDSNFVDDDWDSD
jgi:hypothetical protein